MSAYITTAHRSTLVIGRSASLCLPSMDNNSIWASDLFASTMYTLGELTHPLSDQHIIAQIGNGYALLTYTPLHLWIRRVACIGWLFSINGERQLHGQAPRRKEGIGYRTGCLLLLLLLLPLHRENCIVTIALWPLLGEYRIVTIASWPCHWGHCIMPLASWKSNRGHFMVSIALWALHGKNRIVNITSWQSHGGDCIVTIAS